MNECITYFSIDGDFDPADATKQLALYPHTAWRKGDLRPDGKSRYTQSTWTCGHCDGRFVYIGEQVRQTLAPLRNKTDALRTFRHTHNVSYTVEIVPHLYAGETAPAIDFDTDIIDFCHAIGAKIDIDLYVYNQEETEE